ncbi:countin-1-like [Mercenaria mercenaria]|uniref:countin-1-like n=1 Tax=Mercenaria mercenaria TaxID=6596 RepID=UPI00234F9AA3|nr:countin-1-like [Mercenaria mercenaria]
MKGFLALAVSVILLAHPLIGLKLPSLKTDLKVIKQDFIQPVVQAERVGLDKCKTCIDFAGQALNQLLNIILQGGVIGGCADLCNALASKTSPAIGTVCNLLCDIVGVEEFIKIIQKADLDPIYYCELIPVCPINDNGDASFTSFTATPKSGPQGTFALDFAYTSKNGTGTGEISLEVDTVDGIPLGQSFYHALAQAGDYNGEFQLNAKPDPNCDPSQGPCEQWLAGDYTVKIAICNGECGSKHPHSQIYDETTTTFTITQ